MIVEKFTKKRRGAEPKRTAKTPEGSEVDKVIRCVMEEREISGNYDLLHKTKGGVHMLIGAAFTLLSTPKERCAMARYIFDQESQFHGRANKKEVLRCLKNSLPKNFHFRRLFKPVLPCFFVSRFTPEEEQPTSLFESTSVICEIFFNIQL